MALSLGAKSHFPGSRDRVRKTGFAETGFAETGFRRRARRPNARVYQPRICVFDGRQKVKMGIAQQVDATDFHVEAIDLLSNHVPAEVGIALVVAGCSAIKHHSVQAGLIILGDLSIQGNIKSVRSLAEPLQLAMDNGARRAHARASQKNKVSTSIALQKSNRYRQTRSSKDPGNPPDSIQPRYAVVRWGWIWPVWKTQRWYRS